MTGPQKHNHASALLLEEIAPMYRVGLLRSFEDEIAGEAFFSRLAEHCAGPAGGKLQLLAQVERCTAGLLAPLLARHDLAPRDAVLLASEGRRDAEAWCGQDWPGLARRFAREFAGYVDEFRALEQSAPAQDRAALRLLTEHEEAIVAFAVDESNGTGDGSGHLLAYLARLESFLGRQQREAPARD